MLGPTLRYVARMVRRRSAVLEFEADLDGTFVQGVDMLRWGPDGRLTEFTVLVRPYVGLQALIERMAPPPPRPLTRSPGTCRRRAR